MQRLEHPNFFLNLIVDWNINLNSKLEENTTAASNAAQRAKTLEGELQRMIQEKEITDENGDLAHQESAKLKHMLLIGSVQIISLWFEMRLYESCKFNMNMLPTEYAYWFYFNSDKNMFSSALRSVRFFYLDHHKSATHLVTIPLRETSMLYSKNFFTSCDLFVIKRKVNYKMLHIRENLSYFGHQNTNAGWMRNFLK